MSAEEFVAAVTEGQPLRPQYFAFDAQRNRELHPLLDEDAAPRLLDVDEVLVRRDRGCASRPARAGRLRRRAPARAVNIGCRVASRSGR